MYIKKIFRCYDPYANWMSDLINLDQTLNNGDTNVKPQ